MKTLGERLNGLRWRLTATKRLWSAGAEPDMTFLAPSPFDAATRGRLDVPLDGEALEAGRSFGVRGWVAFSGSPTARVEVYLGDRPLGRARLGLARPDVAENGEGVLAAVSGFELSVDPPGTALSSQGTTLRIVATSADGQQQELSARVTALVDEGETEEREIAPPAARTPRDDSGSGRRILVATHQLNLGGAQLYLLDLLRGLVEQGLARPTVVSAMDGVVRADLEELGIPVHISSIVPVDDLSCHIGRIEELVAWAEGREFEAVFVNTATALATPGAEAAVEMGLPLVWAIHESFPPEVLWGTFEPEIQARIESALASATAVVFEAEATQRLYEPLLSSNGLTVPYGLDLKPIEAARERLDLSAARAKAGIPEDAVVFACVGTVEPRKAQIPLAQAFDLIAADHPDAHLVFVGGGDNPDSVALADLIEASPQQWRLHLIPITPEVERWYAIADVLVCASDVESLPRTVLEAMAWETPVLATSVFGLPELIDHGETGWLFEPRDVEGLAEALDQILRTPPEERREVARKARALVEQRHSLPKYATRVSQLLAGKPNQNQTEPPRRIATP